MTRACEICHARKVKCDLPPSGEPRFRCSNCVDAGLECRPHTRKRKRTQVSQPVLQDPNSSPVRIPAVEPVPGLRGAPAQPSTAHTNPAVLSTVPQQAPQSSFLGRSGYITSNDLAVDENDAMQYSPPTANAAPTLSELQSNMLRSASDVCLPPPALRLSLVKSFLERGKPWMPIVDENDLDQLQSQNPASLLLTAVLVAGSKLSTAPNALEWGEKSYFYAKALFYHRSGHKILQSIAATVLMHWWNPSGPEHVSFDSSSLWLRIGVGLAHQFGLHREPDPNLPDARLRRRLWWTLVARDNQISTSHGRPRAIRPEDSNVRPLRLNDFNGAENFDALLFIHFVRIISILGDITEHYRCGSLSELHRLNIETALLRWINELPPALHLYDRKSLTLNPYEFKSRQLHVPYFVALIIFYRSETPGQHFSLASLLAASFVSGIFEEYIAWGDILFLAPASIFYLLVAGLIQISSHRYPNLARNAGNETQTVRISLAELGKRFPTAYGAERIFENILGKSRDMGTASQKFSITLSPIQNELFAAFGPDLCASWPMIFGESIHGTNIESAFEQSPMVRRAPNQYRQNNILQVDGVQSLTSTGATVDLNQNVREEAGQADRSMQLLQPTESLGDFTFGSLEFWWPEWTDPSFV